MAYSIHSTPFVAIIATFILLRFTQRKDPKQKIESENIEQKLSARAKTALFGIAVTITEKSLHLISFIF